VIEKKEIQKKPSTKKELKFLNRNVAIFVFFLFLSFVFWYLNALGKEIEAEIRYQVTYTNPPKEREFVEEQPVDIFIGLKGTGYSILKLKLKTNTTPFVIDVSKTGYKRVPGSRELSYFILTGGLSNSLSQVLKSEFKIESIKPDTLFFTLNKIPVSVPVNQDD